MKNLFRYFRRVFFLSMLTGIECVVLAQSATVTGVVYEQEQAKITFETPKGKKTVYLPDDMRSGDIITGRVVDEPAGANEKQKAKNLAELIAYKLVLPGGNTLQMAASVEPMISNNGRVMHNILPFQVSSGQGSNLFALELQNMDHKPISKADLFTLPGFPVTPGTSPAYLIAKKIISNTEPLVILQTNSGNHSPVTQVMLQEYYSTDPSGGTAKAYSLPTSVSSPHKVIVELPPGISGMFSVCVQSGDGSRRVIDLINIVDIRASIGKGNLQKGEITQLKVAVSGLEGCPYRPVELGISNYSPAIIRLENGDRQTVPLDPNSQMGEPLETGHFEISQQVTGQSIGNFEIETLLQVPVSAYTNPVQPYLEEIRTPEEFNASMEALQSDLNQTPDHIKVDKVTDLYIRQVADMLPRVEQAADLSRSKSLVSNLLNPLGSMTGDRQGVMGGSPILEYLPELNKLHPGLAEQANMPQMVHPLHDLAGEFDASTHTFLVREDYREPLLEYLGAKKMGDGTYNIVLHGDNGQPVSFTHISPKPFPAPSKEQPGGDCKPPVILPPRPVQNDNVGTKAQSSNDTPKQTAGDIDTPKPDDGAQLGGVPKTEGATIDSTKEEESGLAKLTTEFTDTSGRKYRFYKDAICQELIAPFTVECKPETERTWDPETKTPIDTPTGKYDRWDHLGMKICVKGSGFCTEMNQVKAVQMIFEDKECKRMIKVVNWEGFMCQ